MSHYKVLNDFISNLDISSITSERKQTLSPLVEYIQEKVTNGESIRLNFICTHNSRRSHLSQIWAQTMAHHFGVRNVSCYSGGTEATALFPMVASTLANTGFEVQMLSEGKNPVYGIKFSENEHPVICFSKRMDDDFNPKSDFAAIMTCSQADEGCPFVPGAEKRIPITYDDPKAFDNTPQQAEKYSERSKQIATEMFYVFSQIQN
ncbi:low molecular weight phosphatase family protein [Flagellimonas okinawensis]|uniref:Protein-tyrosine-phosphatase n=1 Tax=Flagellimonas okinawensis TaxID=3031324 RepID=A0ABT5XJ73_9FLAO|nr:protein-tyrosine-phosphatase [[Muricauda] okinawensis]MDF0705916.1 protein-tyrosine-phosphatase [[Muricauda] okinawensis]